MWNVTNAIWLVSTWEMQRDKCNKINVRQDLVFSVKLHFALIPYPFGLIPSPLFRWGFLLSKLQKDFFHPVSGVSTEKCPNYVFAEIFHNMTHEIKQMFAITLIFSFGVELCQYCSLYAKYAMISGNYLKMSRFSSRNVRYPRYQDTDFLQLCAKINQYTK